MIDRKVGQGTPELEQTRALCTGQREKTSFSSIKSICFHLQILSLSERLTEAQGGCESQADLNRRREAEMAKLRKLLEDVHTESEQSIHLLKKKHQEAMMEMSEQINVVTRSKDVVSKEKSRLTVEIQELMARIEVLSQEKTSMKKVVEKLEITV